MGTLLHAITPEEEERAEQMLSFTSRATALVKMGLVEKQGSGFEVTVPGWCRGTVTVSGDLLYCTCGQARCIHRESVRLFVEQPEKKPVPARREDDPRGPNVAKAMADLVTPKQLLAIRIKCSARGLSAEAESLRLFQCPPERLKKSVASRMIDYLETQ